LKNYNFSSRSRRVEKFYRRYIVNIQRIKFSRATQEIERKDNFSRHPLDFVIGAAIVDMEAQIEGDQDDAYSTT